MGRWLANLFLQQQKDKWFQTILSGSKIYFLIRIIKYTHRNNLDALTHCFFKLTTLKSSHSSLDESDLLIKNSHILTISPLDTKSHLVYWSLYHVTVKDVLALPWITQKSCPDVLYASWSSEPVNRVSKVQLQGSQDVKRVTLAGCPKNNLRRRLPWKYYFADKRNHWGTVLISIFTTQS